MRLLDLIFLFLLSAIVPVSLFGQKQQLEAAWNLAAQGKPAEAIDLLHVLVRQDPKNADARLLLGSLLADANARDEAIAELTKAVQLRPASAEAFNALGETYQKFNLHQSARTSFEKAVALRPAFAVAQENLGAILLEEGDQTAAAIHLDKAIPLLKNPNDAAEAEYLRSKIDSSFGNFAQARKHLERAVTLRPDFAEAWSDLGMARKGAQDSSGAMLALQRAVELNPSDPVANYRLGTEYLDERQPEQALVTLRTSYRLNSNDQSTLNALQTVLRQTGQTDEAAALKAKLTEILHARDQKRQNTVKAITINNEGAALEKSGRLADALARYQEAVTLDPDHAGIRSNLAIALLRVGHWTEGLTELRTALDQDPENAQLQFALSDALVKAPHELLPEWAKQLAQSGQTARTTKR